jgi:hypothetical protein
MDTTIRTLSNPVNYIDTVRNATIVPGVDLAPAKQEEAH